MLCHSLITLLFSQPGLGTRRLAMAASSTMDALTAALHAASTQAAATFTCSGSFQQPVMLSLKTRDGIGGPCSLQLPGKARLVIRGLWQ